MASLKIKPGLQRLYIIKSSYRVLVSVNRSFMLHQFISLFPLFNSQGTPKMTSVCHLVVHILDINDNKPEFELTMYEETVAESVEVGYSVVQVHATSRDAGVNAEITYGIMAGNELGNFRIDSETGGLKFNLNQLAIFLINLCIVSLSYLS